MDGWIHVPGAELMIERLELIGRRRRVVGSQALMRRDFMFFHHPSKGTLKVWRFEGRGRRRELSISKSSGDLHAYRYHTVPANHTVH